MNEQHYGDDLSLENLTQSASVSKSECLACINHCPQNSIRLKQEKVKLDLLIKMLN